MKKKTSRVVSGEAAAFESCVGGSAGKEFCGSRHGGLLRCVSVEAADDQSDSSSRGCRCCHPGRGARSCGGGGAAAVAALAAASFSSVAVVVAAVVAISSLPEPARSSFWKVPCSWRWRLIWRLTTSWSTCVVVSMRCFMRLNRLSVEAAN